LIYQAQFLEELTDPLFAVQIEKYKELKLLNININNFKNIYQLEEKLGKLIKYDNELIDDKVAKVRKLCSNFNSLNKEVLTIKGALIRFIPSRFISPYSEIVATYKPFNYFIKCIDNKFNTDFYFDKNLFDEISRDVVNNNKLDVYSNKMCLYELKSKIWIDLQAFFSELYELDFNNKIIESLYKEVDNLFYKFEIKKLIGSIKNYNHENIDLFNEVEELREGIIKKLELFSENFAKTSTMFENKEFAVQTENIYLEEVKNLSKALFISEEEELPLGYKNNLDRKLGFQEKAPELQLEFPEGDLILLSLEEDSEIELGILEDDIEPLSELKPLDKLDGQERFPNKRLLNKVENIDVLDYEEKSLNINNKKPKLFSVEKIHIYSKDKKNIDLEKYLLFKKGIDKKISYLMELCNKNINEQLESLKAKGISDINMNYKDNLDKYNHSISDCKIKIEKNKNIIVSYNKKLEDLYKKFEINWHECVGIYYSKGDLVVLQQSELLYPRIKDCFSNFEFDNFNNIINDIKEIFEENTESILSIFEEIQIKKRRILEINYINLKIDEKITETNQLIKDLEVKYIGLLDLIYLLNNNNYKEYFKEDKKITINEDLHFILNIDKLGLDNDLIKGLESISKMDIENSLKNKIIELIDDLIEFNSMERYSEKVKYKKTIIELDYTWKDYYNKVMNSNPEDRKLVYKDDIFYKKILEAIKETDNVEIINNKLFVPTQEHILRKYLFERTQDFILAFYNKLFFETEQETFKNFYNILLNVLYEEENFNSSLSLGDYYTDKLEMLNELRLVFVEITKNFINTNNMKSLKSFLFNLSNNFPQLDLYNAYSDFEKAYNRVKILEKKISHIFKPQADYILNYDPWQKKIIKKNYNYFKGCNDKLASANKEKQIQEPHDKINGIKELPFPESNKFEQQIQKLKNIDSGKLDDKPSIIKDINSHKSIKPYSSLLKTPEKKKIKGYQKPLDKGSKENLKPELSYFPSNENQLFTPQKKPNQQRPPLGIDIKNLKSRTPLVRLGGPISMY
nr:hypothetical protein [Burkholderiales bacterium]